MDTIIIAILKESATAALAAFAIWMLKQQMELRIQEQQEQIKVLRNDRETLIQALTNNTEALRRTCQMLENLEALVEHNTKITRRRDKNV